METKTELKTIHDLPEKMKSMYDITDSHECIGDPCFINLEDKNYTIESNGVTHTIKVQGLLLIVLWNASKIMTVQILI
jgi:hypothetical protein